MRFYLQRATALTCLAVLFATDMQAQSNGKITRFHWSQWDTNQTDALCFAVGSQQFYFQLSEGNARQKFMAGLLMAAFAGNRSVSLEYGSVVKPDPCQAWDWNGNTYKVTSISVSSP